jgi:phosphatidylserine synthase
MSVTTSFLFDVLPKKLIFLTKLTMIGSGILCLSYIGNSNKSVQSMLKMFPFTGKKQYFDGEKTPITRGFLHGFMSLFHLVRAIQTSFSIPHCFLVIQYVASFMLHNVPFSTSNEHKIAAIDNVCIASHIALLGSLGGSSSFKLPICSALGISVAIARIHEKGVGSWAYKMSLMPIFAVGAIAWHTSGKLYLPGSPRIPFIYITAFILFALHKKGYFHESVINGVKQKGDAIGPAIAYDLFHGLQVVGTLATLRQVDAL